MKNRDYLLRKVNNQIRKTLIEMSIVSFIVIGSWYGMKNVTNSKAALIAEHYYNNYTISMNK